MRHRLSPIVVSAHSTRCGSGQSIGTQDIGALFLHFGLSPAGRGPGSGLQPARRRAVDGVSGYDQRDGARPDIPSRRVA